MITYYDSWEEAAEHSTTGRAVSEVKVTERGVVYRAEILKSKGRDGILNHRHSAIPIRKATTKEIDSAKRWRPL